MPGGRDGDHVAGAKGPGQDAGLTPDEPVGRERAPVGGGADDETGWPHLGDDRAHRPPRVRHARGREMLEEGVGLPQVEVADGTAEALPAIEVREARPERRLGGALHAEIDGRVDAQPELVRCGAAVALLEEPAHVLDVPGCGEIRAGAVRREREPLCPCRLVLARVDEALGAHSLEDVVLTCDRLLRVALRVVPARGLRQPRQERCLRDREVAHVDVEEGPRRRRDAVGPGAEVDLIEIEVEDVVLRELGLEPEREDELLHLALVAPLRREQQGLHDLLGDRAAALHDLVVQQVRDRGTYDAERVHAVMSVEIGVLGREKGEAHVRRDGGERHEVASLDVELADQRAIVGEDARRDGRLVFEQLIDGRQVRRDLAIDDERRDPGCENRRHRAPGEDPPEQARPPWSCHRSPMARYPARDTESKPRAG